MKLNSDTFELYASKYYDNVNCVDVSEFYEDLRRFKVIKNIFKKYKENGLIKVRAVLNNIITLYNVFSPPRNCTDMLVFYLRDYLEYLKPFLVKLNYWRDRFYINDTFIINDCDVLADKMIQGALIKELG